MKSFLKILLAVVLTGLVVGVGEYFYLNSSDESYGVETERYENKTYGYSIEVPKSWGAIMPYGNSFTDNLYDEMEAIGPLIPSSASCEGCYMSIEVFTDDNALKWDESWVDFYKKLRLDGWLSSFDQPAKYEEFVFESSTYPTTMITFSSDDGNSYDLGECKLVENQERSKMLVFCFSIGGSAIFEDIINSLELN